MHSQNGITFSHRHNEDGSHDSICTVCFQTVATDENEEKLRPYENGHVCNLVDIYRVSQGRIPQGASLLTGDIDHIPARSDLRFST